MVRLTIKSFDLRKARAAVEVGAFSKFIRRELSDAKADSRSPESKLALSQHAMKPEVNMNATVSILAEIPEDLHESLKRYLENHPTWDQDRVFAAALSLFLLQNGNGKTPEASQSYRACARVYLESLFQYPA